MRWSHVAIIALLVLSGCAKTDLSDTASMNVDADSNTFIDVSYGGTNSNTAAGARTNLGLGNVDNTSDLNKPISTAVQAALNTKQNTLSSYSTITNLFGSGSCSGYLYSDGTCDEPAGTGDLLSTNNLSDLVNDATARTNLDVYSKAESDDSSDRTIILPPLTLDPYDANWEDNAVIASQGDVYDEMQKKANLTSFASNSAFAAAFPNLSFSGGSGITISTETPTTPGDAYLNDTTHILTIASPTGYTQFTGSFTAWPARDDCTGALVCQNFEGTGYDNSETWSGSNVDEDYASTYVIRGTQSLEVDQTGNQPEAYTTFSSTSTVYVHFTMQELLANEGLNDVMRIYSANGGEQLGVFKYNELDSTANIEVGTAQPTAATWDSASATVYHIWVDFDFSAHTGELYIGSSTTKPASPILTFSSGNNSITTATYIEFTGGSWDSGHKRYIDQVIVKATEFTSVEE